MATKSYWQQFQQTRFSRRRVLAVTGTSAAGLAIAAACGKDKKDGTPGPDGTPGTSAGTPKAGGTYKTAITGDWGSINPLTSVSFGPGILAKMYNALVFQSPVDPAVFYLDLASEYEQPDDSTYVFTLRPDAMIAPNSLGIQERALDSADCQAWLDAIGAADTAVAKSFTDEWLESYTADSPTTFTIKTKGPYAYFFFRLNSPLGGMIPPKEMLEMDMASQGVGAGPYVLEDGSFVETGGANLNANPNYYRKDENNGDAQLPYISRLEISRISDRQPRRTAFIGDQIDSYDPETKAEVDELSGQMSGLQVFEAPAYTFIGVTMNPTKPPWDNPMVRRAMNYGLNRQQYVDVIVQGAGQINGLVHWPLKGYALDPSELEQLQPFDPAQSRQLIQDAGFDVPLSVKFMWPANSDIEFHSKHLPIWLEQMEAAGFAIDPDPQEFTVWLQNYTDINYDASFSLNQIYEIPEVNLDFHTTLGPTHDGSYAIGIGQLYPEVDAAVAASKSSIDPEAQVEMVKEAQRLIYSKDPAFLPIMSWTDYTVRPGKVKDWPKDVGTGMDLYLSTYAWLDV